LEDSKGRDFLVEISVDGRMVVLIFTEDCVSV
jgi:hypothetical protein